MKKWLMAAVLVSSTLLAHAASIEGRWQTIDDKTNQPKAVVQISRSGNTYNGTIVALAPNVENVCPACGGNRPLIGLRVVSGLQQESGNPNKYSEGKIYDPKSGKTYRSHANLSGDGNTLEVRGYIGISLIGRTQTWRRVR